MKKEQISTEELEKSLQYLEAFSKGQESAPVEGDKKPEDEDEPDDELYAAHKKRVAAYIDKAMCHKGYMDKIKKGEPLPDEAFDDLDEPANGGEGVNEESKEHKGEEPAKEPEGKGDEESKKPEEKVEKGNHDELHKQDIDEIVKAQVIEVLNAQKKESDEIIKGLQAEIDALKETPVRKTLIKGADAITLKKAISGEKVDDKTLLSISLQKSKVSEVLFNAYENETDEMTKGQLGDAVAEFESTGNYISPETAQIMESKGYRFIK